MSAAMARKNHLFNRPRSFSVCKNVVKDAPSQATAAPELAWLQRSWQDAALFSCHDISAASPALRVAVACEGASFTTFSQTENTPRAIEEAVFRAAPSAKAFSNLFHFSQNQLTDP